MVVAVGLTCGVLGCDLTEGGEDPRLLGSWVAQDLFVDGVSVKAQLNAQYDVLVLTLREGANGGEFFSIVGRRDGTPQDLFVQGSFDVDGDELTLFPDHGAPIEFTSSFPDSSASRLYLAAEEGSSEDNFLDLIRFPIQGAVDRLEMVLSKEEPSKN